MGIKRIARSPWVQRGLISAGLLGAVALFVDPREIMAQVERLSPGWVALALFISVLQIMLSAWRWQFTAERVGAPLRFSYAWREYYLALLMNQLLPGGVLGDAGRAHRHASQSVSRGSAWRAVIIERTSGQVAVVILTLAAFLLSPLWHAVLGWPVSLVIAIGLCVATVAVWQGLIRLSSPKLPAWWHSMRLDIRRGLLSPGVWNLQLASSLTIVVSYGLVMVCAARAIGVELETLQILALAPVLLLAMLVPLSVAGWGVREGAAVATWALVGLPTAQGVAVSLAYGVLVLLSSLPGIWVALSRHHRAQPSGEGGGAQQHVKQSVVATAKPAHRRAQRTFKRFDGRHLQPGSARADQQRSDQKMQAINHACLDKLGNRHAAAFHQDATQSVLVKQFNNIAGGELPLVIEWQHAALNGGTRRRKLCIRPHQVQRGRRIGVKQLDIKRHPATGIKHHPRGVSTGNVAYRQLGVISACRTRTNHHRVHQGTQPVQMNQTFLTVDVMRVTAFSRNPPIQALPELGDYPGIATHQRCQTVQQLGGCWRNRRMGVPLPLGAELKGCAGRLSMVHSQKPIPGRLNIQQCFVTSAATWTIGVGHNASALRKPSYLAGPHGPAQAYAIRCNRQLGGLYVSH
ncbi:MAG: flippase-like domain-containing protein [Halomonas sp.]|nr:flippase-like domain-containing protein [Halomonas sp.]